MKRIFWQLLALALIAPIAAGTVGTPAGATSSANSSDAHASIVVSARHLATPTTDAPPTTEPPSSRPPTSANEFFPEERDLTSCIGVLERPGCGSESRGGWRQTLVLLAIFGGLLIVFGNIARGVRKNRRANG